MPGLKEMEQVYLVIGVMGSDAGYSVLTSHGIVHVPGNNPEGREVFESLARNYAKLQEIAARQVGEHQMAEREE